jgi:branched-subunit amino acid aminotransferase/4-amino-4-deoxychorismate lyase
MLVQAPWHAGGQSWELEAAKTLSYAPNLAAGRHAQECGFSDAALVSREGWLLEGPTFSIAWVVGETLETPSLDLSILDTITRRVVLGIAASLEIPVREGRFGADRLTSASEVMALSTTKEVAAVRRLDAHLYPIGPVTERLAAAFASEVEAAIRGRGEPI